jgi:hypothetical protein
MDMTDEQRRWWFANHPEFSWGRTRARLLGRMPGAFDPEERFRANLANEHLRQALGLPPADPDRMAAHKARMRELGREHGLHDVSFEPLFYLPQGRALKAPIEALKLALRKLGRDAIISNIKRPPRLPPKGTPERAKIEAARSRGRDTKMREELSDIENGGEGSGVWTKKELEEIRKTKEFPLDTVWHHEPSVANRPKLADNPLAVRPIRGGTKGHLRDGHGGNWQNPYDPGGKAPWE